MIAVEKGMSYKEALQIAAQMIQIPYDEIMHSSHHPDIIHRLFNLATEIQQQYDAREIPELKSS